MVLGAAGAGGGSFGMPGEQLTLGFQFDTDAVKQSMGKISSMMNTFTQTLSRIFGQGADRSGMSDSILGRVLFPSARDRANVGNTFLSPRIMSRLRQTGTTVAQTIGGTLTKSMQVASQGLTRFMKDTQGLGKAMVSVGKVGAQAFMSFGRMGTAIGKGAIAAAPKVAGAAWKGTKFVGRNLLRGAMFGGGTLIGFLTGAFQEAMQAYEQTQRARLEAAPAVGPRGRFFKGAIGGRHLAFTQAEVANLQAQAARSGMGGGPEAGMGAAILARSLGPEAIGFGGGLMARAGMKGPGGVNEMLRKFENVMTGAMQTGLDRARIPELLQAANQYAEQQVQITPGQDFWQNFMTEIMRAQMTGGPAFQGRFAANAMMQAGRAIQQAQGPAQTLAMRAFGFGQGAGLFEVLKRQEKVAGADTLMAVMKQLREEYGSGRGGGLSEAGMLAFKGMGMGSLHMAEKFNQIYLEQREGKISPEEAHRKSKEIMEAKKNEDLPPLARDAFANVKAFGAPIARLAVRFDRMADLGEQWFPMLRFMDQIQKQMIEFVKPVMAELLKVMPELSAMISSLAPLIKSVIAPVVTFLGGIFKFITGFVTGFMESKNTGFTAIGKRIADGLREGYNKSGASKIFDETPPEYMEKAKKAIKGLTPSAIGAEMGKGGTGQRYDAAGNPIPAETPGTAQPSSVTVNTQINMPKKGGTTPVARTSAVQTMAGKSRPATIKGGVVVKKEE